MNKSTLNAMIDINPLVEVTVFTHITPQGLTRHFNIDEADRIVRSRSFPIIPIYVDPEFAQQCFIDRGIEQHRLDRLQPQHLLSPLYFAHLPPTHNVDHKDRHLLIDGHHRIVRAYQLGWENIPAYVLEPEVWETILIHGLRDFTPEELQSKHSNIA